ncbi:MAG: radical SAM protein [Elusimicrobiota bacterium]
MSRSSALEPKIDAYRRVLGKLTGGVREKAWSRMYWSGHDLGVDRAHASQLRRERLLVARLVRGGIKGWPRRRTLFTRSLPFGCRPCVKGRAACLSVTNVCTRDCFFCPNPRPRKDEACLGGLVVDDLPSAPRLVERFGLESIGVSGGDPLTRLPRTLRLARALRRRFGPRLRMNLYTNGDLLTEAVLRRLKRAGVAEIRINLVANEFDLEPLKRALGHFRDVVVEIPVVPEQRERLRRLIGELDELGLPHLVLHELAYSKENFAAMSRRGHRAKSPRFPVKGMRPVSESGLAALELLLHALKTARRLSVYYCSHDTIEMINERGVRYRRSRLGPAGARLAKGLRCY